MTDMTNRQSLREQLISGDAVLGAFLFMGSADVAEVMGIAGFKLLIVDREHASADLSDALTELRAIRSVCDAFVMARCRDASAGSIKPLLDAGFDGILVADVKSGVEARAIAEAARYAPIGRRGAHFTVSRAARYGLDSATHAETANRSILVGAMIESREGIESISDIAKTPGIDMLFLGPLDMTTDIGEFGDLASSELRDALSQAEDAILKNEALLGGAALPGEAPSDLFKRGYSLVTGASDVGLLMNAAQSAAQLKKP